MKTRHMVFLVPVVLLWAGLTVSRAQTPDAVQKDYTGCQMDRKQATTEIAQLRGRIQEYEDSIQMWNEVRAGEPAGSQMAQEADTEIAKLQQQINGALSDIADLEEFLNEAEDYTKKVEKKHPDVKSPETVPVPPVESPETDPPKVKPPPVEPPKTEPPVEPKKPETFVPPTPEDTPRKPETPKRPTPVMKCKTPSTVGPGGPGGAAGYKDLCSALDDL